jgi:hypothetical protein
MEGGHEEAQARLAVHGAERKKEEFPGNMENMLPGNSFPQICVVSVYKHVGNRELIQRHFGSVAESNR